MKKLFSALLTLAFCFSLLSLNGCAALPVVGTGYLLYDATQDDGITSKIKEKFQGKSVIFLKNETDCDLIYHIINHSKKGDVLASGNLKPAGHKISEKMIEAPPGRYEIVFSAINMCSLTARKDTDWKSKIITLEKKSPKIIIVKNAE